MATELEEAEGRRRSLTADIAHELRTPTSNIQGYIEAIKDGVFQPTPETVDTIHEQALLLSRLVEDLRLLAQVDGGELQLRRAQTRVEELVQSCVDALRPRAGAKGVSLGLDVADTLPELDLDPTRIAQAVGNLLDNAITHTPEGGSITVSAHASVDAVEVQVADTGPGIAPDDLPHGYSTASIAPTPPVHAAPGGTGLGLTIARRLVEAHSEDLSKPRAWWDRAAGSSSACLPDDDRVASILPAWLAEAGGEPLGYNEPDSPVMALWRIVTGIMVRMTGGLMLAYSALYTAHFIFRYPLRRSAHQDRPQYNLRRGHSHRPVGQLRPHARAVLPTGGCRVASRCIRPLLRLLRPGNLVLPQLGPPACLGGGGIGQRPLGRHQDGHRRSNPSRPGHHRMATLAQARLNRGIGYGCRR